MIFLRELPRLRGVLPPVLAALVALGGCGGSPTNEAAEELALGEWGGWISV